MRNLTGKIAVGPWWSPRSWLFFQLTRTRKKSFGSIGLINARSDAGIFLMVSTRDFAEAGS